MTQGILRQKGSQVVGDVGESCVNSEDGRAGTVVEVTFRETSVN